MKRSKLFLFVFAFSLGLSTLVGCKKCKETGEVTIAGDAQYFTVTYRDIDGTNAIDSIFNLSNVSVLYTDRFQPNPQYIPYPYSEDFTDGKLGPIPYTTSPVEALLGVPYNSEFVIKMDTFGWDTIRVEFVAQVDDCKEYWAEIAWFLNGDPQADLDLQEIVNFDRVIQ